MTATLNTETTEQLTGYAQMLASILDQKSKLEEQEKYIKTQIRALVDGPDTYAAGGVSVTVQTNRRFSQAKALELIPAEVRDVVSSTQTVIDKDKVKALLPALYDACFDEGDWKIGLK